MVLSYFLFSVHKHLSISFILQNEYIHNLNWRHQSAHVTETLHEILTSNTFTDVTLISDDNIECHANRAVLSAYSSTFKTIFKKHDQYDPVIYLTGCEYQQMNQCLNTCI